MVENSMTIVNGELSIHVTEYEISIHKNISGAFRKNTLLVQPFNQKMFWGKAVDEGYQIKMEGSSLGSYTDGPIGFPGDGEYEIYSITRVSISAKYGAEGLNVELEAETGKGKEVCFIAGEETTDRFPRLIVNASFLVPMNKLMDFLGQSENHFEHLQEKICKG